MFRQLTSKEKEAFQKNREAMAAKELGIDSSDHFSGVRKMIEMIRNWR